MNSDWSKNRNGPFHEDHSLVPESMHGSRRITLQARRSHLARFNCLARPVSGSSEPSDQLADAALTMVSDCSFTHLAPKLDDTKLQTITLTKALRTHVLRLLGPKTILFEVFGLFSAS